MSSGSVYSMSVRGEEESKESVPDEESNQEEEGEEEVGRPPPSWKRALENLTLPTYILPWENHQKLIEELKKIYPPEKKSR